MSPMSQVRCETPIDLLIFNCLGLFRVVSPREILGLSFKLHIDLSHRDYCSLLFCSVRHGVWTQNCQKPCPFPACTQATELFYPPQAFCFQTEFYHWSLHACRTPHAMPPYLFQCAGCACGTPAAPSRARMLRVFFSFCVSSPLRPEMHILSIFSVNRAKKDFIFIHARSLIFRHPSPTVSFSQLSPSASVLNCPQLSPSATVSNCPQLSSTVLNWPHQYPLQIPLFRSLVSYPQFPLY